jgi:GNAT superfamily N-acetyltransferase
MPFLVDRLLPGDLEGGLHLSTQAGWNQTASDWKRILDLCPEGVLAGRLDGRLVATGSVAAISPTIRWIGMILVDEAVRARGYGSLMMDRCLELACRRGDEIVGLDASDLGRPVYLRKGFVVVAPIDRWSGVLNPGGDSRAIGQVTLSSFPQVAELDQEACGVDRSWLLRNLLSDPEGVCFAAFGKALEGFAFVLPGRTGFHAGPVVARDETVLRDLLGAISGHVRGSPVILDSPRTDANSWTLERCGLTIVRRLTRMTRGRSHRILMGPRIRAAVSFTWG